MTNIFIDVETMMYFLKENQEWLTPDERDLIELIYKRKFSEAKTSNRDRQTLLCIYWRIKYFQLLGYKSHRDIQFVEE